MIGHVPGDAFGDVTGICREFDIGSVAGFRHCVLDADVEQIRDRFTVIRPLVGENVRQQRLAFAAFHRIRHHCPVIGHGLKHLLRQRVFERRTAPVNEEQVVLVRGVLHV